MVSSISVVFKEKYLSMTVAGTYDYEEFMDYPQQILKECEENQCFRILVDLKSVIAHEIALIELFFLGERIGRILGDKVMIALVWKKESLSDFLADVATNRSARLKVFDSSKQAELWLINEP
jgi:hypothetical protein